MVESEYKILVIHDNFLKDVFATPEISDAFDYTFTTTDNFSYFKSQLNQEFDLILFGTSFLESGSLPLLEKIKIPSVLVFNHLEESLQLELLKSPYHIEEVIPFETVRLLVAKLNKILVRHKEEKLLINQIKSEYEDEKSIICEIDPITEIYNEQTFLRKTKDFVNSQPDTALSILRFDIDNFKAFNESYGVEEGNKLLRLIGQKIRELSFETLITYGHIRGDHFAVCTKLTDEFSPEVEINYLKNFLSNLYPDWYFQIRLGIYTMEPGEQNILLSLSRSLIALESIKSNFNKNYAYYREDIKNFILTEQIMASEMVTALQDEQFVVFLQPQYDYATETLVGAEALVRWIHPEKGLIPPDKFIPLFEKNGFIARLDLYVWDHVCQLIQKWIQDGNNPVPISVNISRRDLYDQDLVQIFSSLLKKYNLSPANLNLEITESAYMENPEQLIKVVKELQELGFRIEMDDFGSGYSSLNTLKDVPVDVLKLDMQFIRSTTETDQNKSSRGGSILSSIIRMASWLRLPVIAEGIESKNQAEYLKSIGCFLMQGYYFGKPMPTEQFEDLLTTLPSIDTSNNSRTQDIEETKSVDFLNATNQDLLLFNNFVGGAAIIEWIGTKLEIVRVNEQFCSELGINQDKLKALKKNMLSSIKQNFQNEFLSSLAESKKTGKESFCELQFKSPYDNSYIWVRTRCRHIGKTVTSDIYYFSIENIDFKMQVLDINTTLTEQLQTIMEYVPCGILCARYINNVFYFDYANKTFADLFHVSLKDLPQYLKSHTFAKIKKDIVDETQGKNIQMKISDRKVIRTEISAKLDDGTVFNGKVIIQLMRKTEDSWTINSILTNA